MPMPSRAAAALPFFLSCRPASLLLLLLLLLLLFEGAAQLAAVAAAAAAASDDELAEREGEREGESLRFFLK